MCTPSMPSISMMPNKNAKRTETTVVNKGLQLTVIAVFEVMGNSVSISSSEIQCPASSGYQCIQSPAVRAHFLLLQLKKSVDTKSKCCSFLPLSLPLFPVSPEESVTMVTSPSDAQTKSPSLVRLPSRQKGIGDLDGATRSREPHSPPPLSRVGRYQTEDTSSDRLKEGNLRMSFNKSCQRPPVITSSSPQHFS